MGPGSLGRVTSPNSGALRLLRAGSLTVAVLGLSLMAHVVAGGHAPSAGVTAALGLGVFWACTVLTWRRLGRLSLTTAVLASQVVLHKVFDLLAGPASCVELVHAHVGHPTAGATIVCSGPMPDMASAHGTPGLSMVVAHGMAAVLVGLLLAGGEAALWFLAGLVWRPVVGTPDLAVVASRGRVAIARTVLPARSVLSGGVGRRGPPAASQAFG